MVLLKAKPYYYIWSHTVLVIVNVITNGRGMFCFQRHLSAGGGGRVSLTPCPFKE